MATGSFEYNGSTQMLDNVYLWEEDVESAEDERKLAMQRGVFVPSTLEGARIIELTGTMMSPDGNEDTLRSEIEALAAALAVEEPQWLYLWTDRRIKAVKETFSHKYKGGPDVGLPWAADIRIVFKCPDPIWQTIAPEILCTSGGASGDADTLGTFAINYDGTAPSWPLLRFVMNHPSNAIKDWTYYGPNLLTNTRFDQGQNTTQAGVPQDWIIGTGAGSQAYGAADTYCGFTNPHASLIVGPVGATRFTTLSQRVPLTEIGTILSGQVEICVTKYDLTGGSIRPGIEFYNAAGGYISGVWGGLILDTDCGWETVTIENQTAPANTAYVDFTISAINNLAGTSRLSILIRNPALVRSATASFPGHYNNRILDVSRAGQGGTWTWGEVFEVDCDEKTVRYMAGNEYVNAWPYFDNTAEDSEQDFFCLHGSSLPLHFSWIFDNQVRYMMSYPERYWNA